MKLKLLSIVSVLCMLLMGSKMSAQVTSVNYQMKYDTATCLYNCYAIINAGSAVALDDRIGFYSQFSLVLNAGDSIEIAKSYTPISAANDTASWTVSSKIKAPAAQSQNDFWSVVPNYPATCYYANPVLPGDTILLFSVRKIGATTLCAEDIRIFINGSDPSSSAAGMQGSDFSNGFTMGSPAQLYAANSVQGRAPSNFILSTDVSCSTGIEIDLITSAVSSCQAPLAYSWTGPASYTGTAQDVSISTATTANNGRYYVTVSDNIGCSDTISVVATAKPNAGVDQTVCAGTTNTIVASPTTGTWFAIGTAPTPSTVTPGTASVTFNNAASGIYKYKYVLGSSCSDTMQFTVNPKPTITMTDLDGCVGDTVTGNLTPITLGSWVSSNPAVATVSTNGSQIIAKSPGTTTFTYTRTLTGCSSTTVPYTVNPNPTIVFPGPDSTCIGSTINVSPNISGTWVSSNTGVATITNGGIITGVASGTTTITYTETATGCMADTNVIVVTKPTVSITGNDSICINNTTTVSPTTGGSWLSNNLAVATITNGGLITAVGNGIATFTFTNSATGCSATTSGLIVDPKPTVSSAADTICVGASTSLSPTLASGTWANLTPSIISMAGSPTRVVTGLDAGEAQLLFTETGTGCASDTLKIEVEPRPIVSITGDNFICVGSTTTMSPTTGGVWTSSDANIASINNVGVVTGVSAGTADFTFVSSSSLCSSDPSAPVTVLPKPVVAITGDPNICIGETTQLSPSSGGSWVSDNPSVASVTDAGLVTGLASGVARFTFTDGSTGCVSSKTNPVSVGERPIVSITGDDEICIGLTTTVAPTTGGTWTSSNPAVATVNNAGLVTSVAAGTVQLVYTQTNNSCPSDPLDITVAPKPTVSITGDTAICVGATTTMSPTTGGSWVTSNASVATISSGGVVTGVTGGIAFFTFTSDAGCQSNASDEVTVNNPTTTSMPESELCIGEFMILSPTTGGTWTSSVDTIASVTDSVVMALYEGTVNFTFTDTVTGCITPPTSSLTVHPKPTVTIALTDLCIGKTTTVAPTSGGTWQSSNTAVATVSNSGNVVTVGAGTVSFTWTSSATTCASDPTATLTVDPGPAITLTGDSELCIGETTTFTPTTGGTWASSAPTVATITNGGVVTAVAQGQATFTFTETATGCKSVKSQPIIVNGKPTVFISGSDFICLGSTTQLFPSTGGTWASSDAGVASVSSGGVVTGNTVGTATFTFTDSTTGCDSDETLPVEVGTGVTVSIVGESELCVGGTTQLSPSTGGTWASSDATVATVDNNGLVVSKAPGSVTFIFTDAVSGCANDAVTDTVKVSNCSYPDFNVTFVNVSVAGDVSTNDLVAGGTTYDTPNLNSKPVGSVATITLNSDGTYTFVADMVGVYKYRVPVCVPPQTTGCSTTDLWITVLDHTEPTKRPVANVDFATTPINTAVTLISLENDDCVVVTGCILDPASVAITVISKNGAQSVNSSTGDITYTPNTGFTGQDTLTYKVCVNGEPTNCATAKQIISVVSTTALNSTVAADDFASTPEDTPVSGNVSTNDSDPEGDNQTVVAQNVTVPAGQLVLATDGSYTFTPAKYFTGPVEFIYQTCDDNVSQECVYATLHLLVVPDFAIKIRVYLEGSLMANAGATATDGRPLMRDNLRSSPFNTNRYIPNKDPYKYTHADYDRGGLDMASLYTAVPPGGTINQTRYDSIPDPTTVFAVTGQNAIVDWVFVELRDKTDSTSVISTRAGLLQRDADVVDLDGFSALRFPGLVMDNYYVVVRHRSHLGAMTKVAQTPKKMVDLVDFTKSTLDLYDFGTNKFPGMNYTGLAVNEGIKFGWRALWAGTFDINTKIKFDNPNDDLNYLFFDVFGYPTNTSYNVNYDFAYGYMPGDYDMNGKAKYDNPNDDKNMLYAQLLFYPLNTSFLSNFDFFIEQIP